MVVFCVIRGILHHGSHHPSPSHNPTASPPQPTKPPNAPDSPPTPTPIATTTAAPRPPRPSLNPAPTRQQPLFSNTTVASAPTVLANAQDNTNNSLVLGDNETDTGTNRDENMSTRTHSLRRYSASIVPGDNPRRAERLNSRVSNFGGLVPQLLRVRRGSLEGPATTRSQYETAPDARSGAKGAAGAGKRGHLQRKGSKGKPQGLEPFDAMLQQHYLGVATSFIALDTDEDLGLP